MSQISVTAYVIYKCKNRNSLKISKGLSSIVLKLELNLFKYPAFSFERNSQEVTHVND